MELLPPQHQTFRMGQSPALLLHPLALSAEGGAERGGAPRAS